MLDVNQWLPVTCYIKEAIITNYIVFQLPIIPDPLFDNPRIPDYLMV